ncbi:DUF1329 domain-containing protein [Paraburkholderia oxyphila]|uniref:DUF1329 domain-containing protein n=1 Tax=Paraburkholderia oxyphila TaxID=614212 RepID=UPI000483B20A|nr:DUF1329 domain-containing protein [Paraburkholderia oxyphila]
MTRRVALLVSLAAAVTLATPPAITQAGESGTAAQDGPLTPMGAERAGNKDGTIPAWSGKWLGAPPGIEVKANGRYPDPYADEKPLFVITAENMATYSNRLTDGEIALFKRYPATFQMAVYPSHRDFRYDESVYKDIATYAPDTQMTSDGNGLSNAPPQVPYPKPQTGLQLLWNLRMSSSIGTESATYDQAVVYPNGDTAWGRVKYDIYSPREVGKYDVKNALNNKGFFREFVELPLNERGTGNVGYEILDHSGSDTRRTWTYNPGTRRVRQAPEFGFDQPQGPGGFRTVDDDRLFNGSGSRYDWKIVGKAERYVPYDNYRLMDPSIKYDDLLGKGHPNPKYMRYELHRVWVLEATLKPGSRHQYAKRVLYLDEDTWIPVAADNYDARGQLWRTNQQATVYAFDAKRFYTTDAFYHDLTSGAYMADRLTNRNSAPLLNNSPQFDEAYFSPDSIRSAGN